MTDIFVGTALKSVLILALASIASWLLRRHSAASRHMVWCAACVCLLAVPLLSMLVPAIPLPGSAAWMPLNTTFEQTAIAHPNSTPVLDSTKIPPANSRVEPRTQPVNWTLLLINIWVAGVAAALAQMLYAWLTIWQIRRSAKSLQTPLIQMIAAEACARPIDILETQAIRMPITFGWWKPAVILPAEARTWDQQHTRMVLLHELAHVERRDLGWQFIARTALSLYWWNPLAWLAWRSFVREREQAADDIVLRTGTRASDYATLLLEMARAHRAAGLLDAAAIAMARPAQLEGRLMKILDSNVNRNVPGRMAALTASVCALLLIIPLAAIRAQDSQPGDEDALIRSALSQKDFQMLDNAARSAEGMLKFDVAKKLLETSLNIRSRQSAVDYGAGLLKLAQFEQRLNHLDQAEALYQKVLKAIGDGPDAATAWIHLGTIAMIRKDLTTASINFEKAQALSADHPGAALMWLGVLREHQGDLAEAESFYRRAAADTTTGDAATRVAVLGLFLQRQGRTDEAAPLIDRAVQMRKANSAGAPLRAGVYKIGSDVMRPKVVSKVEPAYSEEARLARYQGTEVLSVEIGTDGLAHNLQVLRDVGLGLDEKAMQAVSQWKFEPGTKDGQPVTVAAVIEINWKLQ